MTTGGRTFAGRYSLDVQISTAVGTPVWRALDQVLRRWVTLYLMPRSDTRSPAVIASCLRVSANSSRNVIAILDVIEAGQITGIATISPAEDYLGIVSEWVEGETLDRRLTRTGEPFGTDAALEIARKIASTLANAHELGISHGRLRPHNVVFSDAGEIRLSGFGIESSVLGADRSNGVQADILGIGNLLFAMVTGTWPHDAVDTLPAAAAGPGIPEPSRVASGVTAGIDRLFTATQDGTFLSMGEVQSALAIGTVESAVPGVRLAADPAPQPDTPRSGKRIRRDGDPIAPATPQSPPQQISQLDDVADEPAGDTWLAKAPATSAGSRPRLATNPAAARLGAAAARMRQAGVVDRVARTASVERITSHPPVEWIGEPDTASHRNRVTAIALGSVAIFGWIGWQLLTSSFGGAEAPPALVVTPLATFSAAPSSAPSASPTPVGIDSASAYDPYGDKVENGNLAALAVDADRATAWQTVVYRGNNLAGKPGVGLVLDLGKAVDVTAVKVRFLASGQDATIYVTDSATPDIATATQLGSFTSGDTSVTVTGDKPLSGRYVVIWLTKVPQIPTGSYQGSIAEVTVLS